MEGGLIVEVGVSRAQWSGRRRRGGWGWRESCKVQLTGLVSVVDVGEQDEDKEARLTPQFWFERLDGWRR